MKLLVTASALLAWHGRAFDRIGIVWMGQVSESILTRERLSTWQSSDMINLPAWVSG